MIGFWIAAAVMIAVVLIALVPPLLRRAPAPTTTRLAASVAVFRDRVAALDADRVAGVIDEDAYREARNDLDRELLEAAEAEQARSTARSARSPVIAVIVAGLLPLIAIGLYLVIGTPSALSPAPVAAPATEAAAPAASGDSGQAAAGTPGVPHSVKKMVAQLEERLKKKPDDADGWLMLGRSYAVMHRLEDAKKALEKAKALRPKHPLTLVALAEVIAEINGNNLAGEPVQLIHDALKIDPKFPRALWLAGIDAFDRGDKKAAAGYWRRLLDLNVLNPQDAGQVRAAIAQAIGVAQGAPEPTPTVVTKGSAALRVRVSLAPALAAKAAPGDTLFIFARAVNGPRMPLAIVRRPAGELPLEVVLDDGMAMMPQLKLSAFPKVIVGARISKSGNATPTTGDLEGASPPVAPGAKEEVKIVINHVVP